MILYRATCEIVVYLMAPDRSHAYQSAAWELEEEIRDNGIAPSHTIIVQEATLQMVESDNWTGCVPRLSEDARTCDEILAEPEDLTDPNQLAFPNFTP